MNSALVTEIEKAQDTNQQNDLIDNAIIASAKEAQEEAKKALAIAAEDQREAQRAKQDAALLVRASEERRKKDAELAETRRDEAVRDERSKAADTTRSLTERHEREMRQVHETHETDLKDKEKLLRDEEAKSAAKTRRIRLTGAACLLVVVFVAAGLAGLFSQVWEYFVVAAVILGFFAGLDQFMNRNDRSPD
jgi:Flp pilus assembly protein TadB